MTETIFCTHSKNPFGYAMACAFVFLIPGYFIYHWLVNIDTIPMFLGGYTNESAALVLAWTALWSLLAMARGRMGRMRSSDVEMLYFAFLMYFSFIVLVHWVDGSAHLVNVSHLASVIQLIAAFTVFRYTTLNSPGLLQVLRFTLVIMSLLVYQSAMTDTLALLLSSTDDTKTATYQGLARAFLLTVATVTAFTTSKTKRILHYLNAITVIFLLGARSEVVGLFIYGFTLEWLMANKRWRWILLATSCVIALLTSAILSILTEWMPESRVLMLLEFQNDGSVRDRSEQVQFALATISDNLILGDYGSYLALGGVGNYAHNILSVWVDLGIVGLILLLALFAKLANVYFKTQRLLVETPTSFSSLHALGVGLLVQTVFLMVAAKTFTDISVAVLVGVTGSLCSQLRSRYINTKADSTSNKDRLYKWQSGIVK